MNTASLEKIAAVLASKQRILLFPHIHMDGDALGSCVALAAALRQLKKEAWVLINEPVPDYLAFLDEGFTTAVNPFSAPDLCMAVDCGDAGRFPGREDVFLTGRETACVDHHATAGAFTDYHYVDAQAAATGELVYQLLCLLAVEITPSIANALYAAIATDTGNFRYSNTSAKTHEITAALYAGGLDHVLVCTKLYENTRVEQLKLHSAVLKDMVVFAEGKAALASVSQQLLAETNTTLDESEGIIEQLRSLKGVEIAILLKELAPHDIKVGLRAKNDWNVAQLAQQFGGGGHVKAAGCGLKMALAEAEQVLKQAVETLLQGGGG